MKAQSKEEQLRFAEVQENMAPFLEKSKDQWLTPAFFEKLAKRPKLARAFQDPTFMKALGEMGKDPKAAMEKYGHSPEFREAMQEFSLLMGNHFQDVADEQKKKEEA